jgi:hypothetical protein
MKLEPHEAQTALWLKLEAHIRDRIETLRALNDGDLDQIRTARTRGRIAALKELLSLSQDEAASGGD